MAKATPYTQAQACASSNVVPFRRASEALAYAPGVPAFDPQDPLHIAAWNRLCAMGMAEARS